MANRPSSMLPFFAVLAFLVVRVLADLLWWVPGGVGGFNLLQLTSGAMFAISMGLLLMYAPKVLQHPLVLVVGLFTSLVFIGGLRGTSVVESLRLTLQYTAPFLMLVLVSVLANTEARRVTVVATIFLGGFVPVAISVWHLIMNTGTEELHGFTRLVAGYANLHNHALAMGLLVPVGMLVFYGAKDWRVRGLGGLLVALAGTVLYLTYVRTAWLGVATFVIVFMVMMRRWKELLVLVPVGLVAIALSDTLQDRFADLFLVFSVDDLAGDRASLGSGRWGIWQRAIDYYLGSGFDDLVLGLGLGSGWLEANRGLDPHNEYVTLLLQLGPIALVSYIGFAGLVLARALAVRRHARNAQDRAIGCFVFALLVCLLVEMGVSNSLLLRPTVAWHAFALFGLVFAIPLARDREAIANLGRLARRRPHLAASRPAVSLRGSQSASASSANT